MTSEELTQLLVQTVESLRDELATHYHRFSGEFFRDFNCRDELAGLDATGIVTLAVINEYLQCICAAISADGGSLSRSWPLVHRIVQYALEQYRIYLDGYDYDAELQPLNAWKFLLTYSRSSDTFGNANPPTTHLALRICAACDTVTGTATLRVLLESRRHLVAAIIYSDGQVTSAEQRVVDAVKSTEDWAYTLSKPPAPLGDYSRAAPLRYGIVAANR